MTEADFYKVLFDEKIFDPFIYDFGNIPTEITFGEFIIKLEKSPKKDNKFLAVISYYKDEIGIPNELLNSINNKYITKECGIYSEPDCITKELLIASPEKLYINQRLGLKIFIEEMKNYFSRVYKPDLTRKKTK